MNRKQIINFNVRLNISREEDRKAWERLKHLDRKKYKSYSRVVITALNDFFDRKDRLETDSYLETREKEDAFLQRVIDTIASHQGGMPFIPLQQPLPYASLPVPESGKSGQIEAMTSEQEESVDNALDFINNF